MRILLILVLVPAIAQASIVGNSQFEPTAEDSLSVAFCSLDSLGNPSTADSLYIVVSGPTGMIVYLDSAAMTDSRVTLTTVAGGTVYHFFEQVSNLDGAGHPGVYCLTLMTRRTDDNLVTPNRCLFQIIDAELSDQIALIGDSVFVRGGVVDSNRTEQGGAGDSTLIAGWVWNTPQQNHLAGGTFGSYLDAPISGVSGGAGAFAHDFIAIDTGSGETLPGVRVAVRAVDQGALVAAGATDGYGRVAFNLEADSFVIAATALGYRFEAYDTLVLVGPGVDTLEAHRYEIDPPASPEVCRLWGYLFDFQGLPEAGATVTAALPKGVVRYSNLIVSPTTVSTTTDSSGLFYLDLLPSVLMDPTDTQYEITISRSDGTVLRERVSVPDADTWQLSW